MNAEFVVTAWQQKPGEQRQETERQAYVSYREAEAAAIHHIGFRASTRSSTPGSFPVELSEQDSDGSVRGVTIDRSGK